MCRNPINFLYNPGRVILWFVEVGPVANAREGSMQEDDRAKVEPYRPLTHDFLPAHMLNGAVHKRVSTAIMVPNATLD